jgi:hypothetical protein
MFPGTVSKLSESTVATATSIAVKSDLVFLTGAVAIATIQPGWSGFSQKVVLIPLAAGATLTAAGNIAVAVALVQNRAQELYFSKVQNKWFPTIAAV